MTVNIYKPDAQQNQHTIFLPFETKGFTRNPFYNAQISTRFTDRAIIKEDQRFNAGHK